MPPIVTAREWDTVQRMRTERAAQSPRSLGSDYLLSGLARCGKCGGTIAGAGNRAGYRYYTCTNRVFLKNCDCAYVNSDKLEAAVMGEVRAAISLENIRHQIEVMEEQLRERVEQHTHVASEAQEALAGVDRKRKRHDQEFFAGNIDGKALSRLSDALEAEAAETSQRLDQAQAELSRARATTVDVDHLLEFSRRVDAYAELSKEELKQVLRDVIGTLAVYQQKVPTRSKKGNPNPIDIVWQPRLNLLYAINNTEATQAVV